MWSPRVTTLEPQCHRGSLGFGELALLTQACLTLEEGQTHVPRCHPWRQDTEESFELLEEKEEGTGERAPPQAVGMRGGGSPVIPCSGSMA